MDDLQFPGLCVVHTTDPRSMLARLCRSGWYALVLSADSTCSCMKYGRRHYDYDDATLTCYRPAPACTDTPTSFLWTVTFHPDLFRGALRGKRLEEYTFFSYAPQESLHTSGEERRTLSCCIEDICLELRHAPDNYKSTILTRHLTRLLDYTARFYERQFITRHPANEILIRAYEELIGCYLSEGKWATRGPLTAACCAERLHLSTAYFEDLVKQEYGHTHHCYLQIKRIKIAGEKLRTTQTPLPRIARELGFPSVPYFNFLFKKITGFTPHEYRSCTC